METMQCKRLSLGEQIYIWIFIYVVKTKFYLGQSAPENAAGCYFGVFQWFNFFVISHSIIFIFNIDIQDTFLYMEIGISICLMLANMLYYSHRIDRIIEKHNMLSKQEQSRNKYRMWIYVVLTILSTVGLLTVIALTCEKPKIESARNNVRIEIPKLHIPDAPK